MERVTSAKAQPGYKLLLRFTDGTEGEVDLSHLVGKGVFSAWEAPSEFAKVEVNEFGAPEWPGGVDLCPDSLYMEATGKTWEEISSPPLVASA